MLDVEEAFNILYQVDTEEELVKLFKTEGIKGQRGMCGRCPVARWMQKSTGRYIKSGHDFIWDNEKPNPEHLRNSNSMREFIVNFDLGFYPELEESLSFYEALGEDSHE